MRNTILAIATTLVLAMGTVPTFAANENKDTRAQSQTQAQTNNKDCDAILANRADHTAAEIQNCQAKQ